MRENGFRIKCVGRGSITIVTDQFILEAGKIISRRGWVFTNSLTGPFSRESFTITKCTELEFSSTILGGNGRESSGKEFFRVRIRLNWSKKRLLL